MEMKGALLNINPLAKFLLPVPSLYALIVLKSLFQREKCSHPETQQFY